MTTKLTSFWKLLQEQYIEVPIIQRDYAQGREEQAPLRKRFLSSLKKALDNAGNESMDSLTLDFIYGSKEITKKNGESEFVFKPIDGQQRLTTLWLLHWYIALKAGKLREEEISKVLKKFSYETRISSREFCEKLCDSKNFNSIEEKSDIVSLIVNGTWFYKSWLQDPTISGMLRMLGSLSRENSDRKISTSTEADNLENLFKDKKSGDFISYWNALTGDRSPVLFHYVPLENFGLNDDLYIKINARGKQLTSFENFKADLINYIREKNWQDLLNPETGLPIKMDTKWTDLFWKNKSNENEIDEIYFKFLNRFFTNEYVLYKDRQSLVNENTQIGNLFRSNYSDLQPYRFKDGSIERTTIDKLVRIMDNFVITVSDDNNPNSFIKSWTNKDFQFIPVYSSSESFSLIDQIRFFCICKYFEEGKGDKESFQRWMRVVENLLTGKDLSGNFIIRSAPVVKVAIDNLDKLDSHHVYESLLTVDLNKSPEDTSDRLTDRWIEERDKAKQILEVNGDLRKHSSGKTWEEVIKEAESYSFFDGGIRFLFRDENDQCKWTDFDKKWKWVQEYFINGESVNFSNSKTNALKNPGDVKLLKALFSRFSPEQFEKVAYKHYRVFNNYANTWRYFLLNKDIVAPIHQLLMSENEPRILERKNSENKFEKIIYQLIADKLDQSSEDSLLDYVAKSKPESWIRNWRGHLSIFPSSCGVFLDAKVRDEFIQNSEISLCHLTSDEDIRIKNTTYLLGANIHFWYKNHPFLWHEDNYIYLLEKKSSDTGNSFARKIKKPDETNPDNLYYRMESRSDIKVSDLDQLIKDSVLEPKGGSLL